MHLIVCICRQTFLSLIVDLLLLSLTLKHIDITPSCIKPDQFSAAMKELEKMDSYKVRSHRDIHLTLSQGPRDKIICILNASKIISRIIPGAKRDGTVPSQIL